LSKTSGWRRPVWQARAGAGQAERADAGDGGSRGLFVWPGGWHGGSRRNGKSPAGSAWLASADDDRQPRGHSTSSARPIVIATAGPHTASRSTPGAAEPPPGQRRLQKLAVGRAGGRRSHRPDQQPGPVYFPARAETIAGPSRATPQRRRRACARIARAPCMLHRFPTRGDRRERCTRSAAPGGRGADRPGESPLRPACLLCCDPRQDVMGGADVPRWSSIPGIPAAPTWEKPDGKIDATRPNQT